jgi:hypothetical protein
VSEEIRSLLQFRPSDLWRRGAGTPEDPDNGRLIWRIVGIYPSRWQWHPNWLPTDLRMTPLGYLRLLWNEIRRYAYETCDHCGRKNAPTIGDAWWTADDATWVTVMGHGGGCLCPRCFTEAARRRGVSVHWQAVAE